MLMKHRVYGTDGAFLKPQFGENIYPLSTSREWDDESSTYYYRARQYDQTIGRFNHRDPIGYLDPSNGENPYPLSTSREWDNEASQYYYRARYYNQSIGKFNTRWGRTPIPPCGTPLY